MGGMDGPPQRSSHDINGSSSYDSPVAQTKEAPISDPPGRPDRPEIADCPYGTPTYAGRITETIDGAHIKPAATVVGRAMGGGPESNVSPGEVAALVRKITGQDHQIVPADQMAPSGTLGSYRLGDRLTTIDGDLEPRSAARVLAHELGHAIEHERWPDGRTVSDCIIREMAPGRPDGPKAPQSDVRNALPGDRPVAPGNSVRNASLPTSTASSE